MKKSSFYTSPDAMIVDLLSKSAILAGSVTSVTPVINGPGKVIKGGF